MLCIDGEVVGRDLDADAFFDEDEGELIIGDTLRDCFLAGASAFLAVSLGYCYRCLAICRPAPLSSPPLA